MWVPIDIVEINEHAIIRRHKSTFSKYDRFLKSRTFDENGYYYYTSYSKLGEYYAFYIGNKSYLVHRMMAEAFIPNPLNLPCVNHKDGNKLNDELSNLEWCTYKDNTNHAVKIGLIKSGKESPMYGKIGKDHPCSKANLGNKYNLGRHLSKETKEKISKKLKGNKNGCKKK